MYEDYEDLVERLRECIAEQNGGKTLWCQAADAIDNLLYICKHQAAEIEELSKKRESACCGCKCEKIEQASWIPVSERLPEVGKKVLVFAYGHDVLTARMQKRTENEYPVFECNGTYLELAKQGRITHWMPLPEPPKDGE